MPWGGAGGQNIEHPHTLAILSCFCFKCILVLLAKRSSGELLCPATALIYGDLKKIILELSSKAILKKLFVCNCLLRCLRSGWVGRDFFFFFLKRE